MKIGFVGMTHLGLCYLAACAHKKFAVKGFDLDREKINNLNNLILEHDEPMLKKILNKNKKKIRFSKNFRELNKLDIVFISLDVKTNNYGEADFRPLLNLINKVKKNINKKANLVILSQVRPGFTTKINFEKKRLFYQVETLIFGQAISRAINPERIIVGSFNNKEINKKYRTFLNKFQCPIIKMNYESAELSKISINIFLASSISISNMLARTCKNISADWSQVVTALKLDKRIGPHAYLKPGLGISGGNLERDLFSIKKIMQSDNHGKNIINSFIKNSEYMKDWVYRILNKKLKKNMIIGILGLAYKDNTNSTKNSPSIKLLKKIKSNKVLAYDPIAKVKNYKNFKQLKDIKIVLKKSHLILLMTDWKNTIKLNNFMKKINLKSKIAIDPYNLIKSPMRKRFEEYINIGN